MRTRSMLRAIVAVAALATAAAPAAAEPTDLRYCVRDAGCVTVLADTAAGTADVAVGPLCAPDTVAAGCTPGAGAGAELASPLTGVGATRFQVHPLAASCSWSGSPGSRVDFGGTAVAAPYAGATVVDVNISCALFYNGVWQETIAGQRWGDQSWAHKTVFPPAGTRVSVCLTSYSARWSDNHIEGLANNQCGPTVG
jgi:hypothetical protein